MTIEMSWSIDGHVQLPDGKKPMVHQMNIYYDKTDDSDIVKITLFISDSDPAIQQIVLYLPWLDALRLGDSIIKVLG